MLRRFLIFLVVLCVLAFGFYAASSLYIRWPVIHPDVEMTIEKGMSVERISGTLASEGVIRWPACFRLYIIASGAASRLRAGDYEFKSGLSAAQVLAKLLKGDFKTYTVTIPEGWTVAEIGDYLKSLPFVDNPGFAGEFLGLSKDEGYIKGLGFSWDVAGLEGYLFPDTYQVYKLRDPRKLVSIMSGQFIRKFSDVISQKGGAAGIRPADIVTIASIVEKETSRPEEKPLVSSVFYNRLKKGMPLQSDPTVIYGLEGFDGNLRKADLANSHKYNTYAHPGLPPGPICNPGEASINAALYPAKTDYLYFVSKNDGTGTHFFSNNYGEHQKAVVRYQIRKNE